jgi:predicted MPP superfamily phosphohydrolase
MRCCLGARWLTSGITIGIVRGVRNIRIASSLIKRQCSTLRQLELQLLSMSTPATPPAHVKTRFLILSDTHSAEPSENLENGNAPFRPPLPRADVLLHCGDLTMIGHLEEYEKTLGMLESIEADLKLVIAGNHDITLDEQYYTRKGQYMHRGDAYDKELPAKAREMWMGERARRAGVTYLEEGTHAFKLKNGASLQVCTSFHISRSLRLTTEGLRIPIPA